MDYASMDAQDVRSWMPSQSPVSCAPGDAQGLRPWKWWELCAHWRARCASQDAKLDGASIDAQILECDQGRTMAQKVLCVASGNMARIRWAISG